jgi:hypothetical protein
MKISDKEIDKRIRKIARKILVCFWVKEWSVTSDLKKAYPKDLGEKSSTILVRRTDFYRYKYTDFRNALYLFSMNISPEIGSAMLSAGQNGKRALAQEISPFFAKLGESLKQATERILG